MRSVATAFMSHLAFVVPLVTSQLLEGCESCNGSSPTATIDSGPVIGKTTQLPDSNTNVNQFLGIPFAQPPLDNLRFSPPEQPLPWEEAYNATSQPMACIQYMGKEGPAREMSETLFNTPPPPGESEDCLYLNVYAPSGGFPEKAVLFWIYGGSGTAGAASQPLYDGTSFAANQDIIVVAANYRVNGDLDVKLDLDNADLLLYTVFGNPRAPQLPLEERNVGLLDQKLALDWVQRNIHAFGGDPKKVTIMGESAGAVAVGNLINTYPDDPPFRGGVLQSGSSLVKIPPPPPNNDTTVWTTLIEHLNCTDISDNEILACARAAPAKTLKEIVESNGISFGEPVQDNVTVLEYPAAAWAAGNVAKVPILIGSTADDGSSFTLFAGDNVNTFIENIFGPGSAISQILIQLYAPDSPATAGLTTGQQIISQIATDSTFRCTSGFVANFTSTLLGVPVWQYMFNASVPSNQWEEYPDLGVYHTSELPLLFGTYSREDSTETEARLSQSMQKQFADFVKDPEKGPGWSQWPYVGVLDVSENDAVTTTEDVRELDAVCATWNELYALALAPTLGNATGAVDAVDATATASGAGSTGPTDVSAADRTAIGDFGIAGAGLIVLAALLWEIGA